MRARFFACSARGDAAIHSGSASQEQRFRSRPDLRPPSVTVTSNSPAVAPGEVLVAPYGGPGMAGPMILDPAGGLLWFKALPRYTIHFYREIGGSPP